jgi:hypothetical protein
MFANIILIFFSGRAEKTKIKNFFNLNYFIKDIIENLLCKNYFKNYIFFINQQSIIIFYNHVISN